MNDTTTPATTDHAEEERHFRNRLMHLVEQGFTTIIIHPAACYQRLRENPLFLYLTEDGQLHNATECNRQVLLKLVAEIAIEYDRQERDAG